MAGKRADTSADDECIELLKYCEEQLGEWVKFTHDDPKLMARTVYWMIYSKYSPFGWSPDGYPTTALRSYRLEWAVKGGGYSSHLGMDPVTTRGGARLGRIRLFLPRRLQEAERP